MAQYTVTAGCGHTTTMQLYGPTKERDRRLDWMSSADGKCNPCYAASKRTEEAGRGEVEIAAMTAKLVTALQAMDRAAQIVAIAGLEAKMAAGEGNEARREAARRAIAAIKEA